MHLPSKRPSAAAAGGGGRGPMGTWAARFGVALLVLIGLVQLISVQMVSQPGLPSAISSSSSSSSSCLSDPCFDRHLRDPNDTNLSVLEEEKPLRVPSPTVYPPRREYKSNGYLLLHCNGGLNQMRAAICDMVTIARHLNITLVIPELDKQSFWADPSDFEDIFDVDHFIKSLRDEVKIVKRIPPKVLKRIPGRKYPSMQPKSWSNLDYYINEILPLIRKHKVVKFEKTDTRLANNGIPLEHQKLRCRVNYDALRFKPQIEELGAKLISILRKHKSFVGLHLRYEMDMLAFSGCTKECSDEEIKELENMRYAISWWKEKEIDSVKKREGGLCPLTPKETALVLKALGFGRDTQIYIAAGDIYGGERKLAPLRAEYPNIVKKEMLLTVEELTPYRNHSNQMAALDYLVSVASDVFLPTYIGNMAKVVVGHRRYNGFLQSIMLDKLNLVPLLDLYENQTLSWDQFSSAVNAIHEDRMGQPTLRNVIPGQPKLEDYFYANPHECLAQEI